MKKNISIIIVLIKVLLFILFFSLVFWNFVSPQYEQSFTGSFIDKTTRIQSINSPKIILVGNSNVAFGFRSYLIEDAFNMQVVNVGLHGALGDEFHENIAKLNINSGDIVVECPSTFGGRDAEMQDYTLVWKTVENHIHLWKCIPARNRMSVIYAFPFYLKDCVKLFLENDENKWVGYYEYARAAFNIYGDNDYVNNVTVYPFDDDYKPEIPIIDDAYIERLNKFNEEIISKGAVYYVAGYPIACETPEEHSRQFADIKKELESKLDCKIISDYQDYMYPYSYFYDTTLHLNKQGAEARTNQLIKDLKAVME